jgi:hypothetical protein
MRKGFEKRGAGRDRTDDLLNAIQALSQLSYGPITAYLLHMSAYAKRTYMPLLYKNNNT